MANGGQKRIIQLTGFKKKEKAALFQCLFRLDCVVLDNKVTFTKVPDVMVTVERKKCKHSKKELCRSLELCMNSQTVKLFSAIKVVFCFLFY